MQETPKSLKTETRKNPPATPFVGRWRAMFELLTSSALETSFSTTPQTFLKCQHTALTDDLQSTQTNTRLKHEAAATPWQRDAIQFQKFWIIREFHLLRISILNYFLISWGNNIRRMPLERKFAANKTDNRIKFILICSAFLIERNFTDKSGTGKHLLFVVCFRILQLGPTIQLSAFKSSGHWNFLLSRGYHSRISPVNANSDALKSAIVLSLPAPLATVFEHIFISPSAEQRAEIQ